jgi:hypothetical protein
MTTSDFTFHLPEEHVSPITAESNDFFSDNGLSCNCFLPANDKKRPFHAEDRTQQRQKTYHRIIRKLTEGNLPGKGHAVSYLQHKYRHNLRTATLRASGYNITFFLFFLQEKGRLRLEDLTRNRIKA